MNRFAQDTELIRGLVAYAGSNPAAVAKAAGVAVTTVNRPFNGNAPSRLGRAALAKLRAAFPRYPGWASYLADDFGAGIDDASDLAFDREDIELIDLYRSLTPAGRKVVMELLRVMSTSAASPSLHDKIQEFRR